jgi:hypothetical protein
VTVSAGPEASVESAQGERAEARIPVRAVLLHARNGGARESVRRAALAAAVEVRTAFAAGERRSFGELAQELRDERPDVVVAWPDPKRAGSDLVTFCEALRLGCATQRPAPRLYVFGDGRASARLAEAVAPIRCTTFAGERELVAALRALRRRDDEGVRLPDEESEVTARDLASLAAADTLVVDVGGATTSLVLARAGGDLAAVHVVPLGLGAGADRVVARGGLEGVRRWLPWAIDAPALLERVFNRARWPDAVPAGTAALALEMALAREAIAHALNDARAAGLDTAAMRAARVVALGGRLAAFPRAAQSLIVAVDALGLSGLSTVIRQRAGTYESVALVASLWPRRAATLRFVHANGRGEERVSRGAFFLAPVKGPVEVTARGADIQGTAEAGVLGMLVDARGHPLALPQRDAERLPTIARWHAAVAALPS